MGTLSLRVAPNGVADQLVVNGVARLAGTMQTVFQPGTGFSKSYNLVTATGGLTGTFSTLSTENLPAFLSASLAYGSTNVTLNLQSSLGSMSGLGGNQSPSARRSTAPSTAAPASMRCRACTACQPARSATR